METNTEEVNKDYIFISGEYRVVIHDDDINFEFFFFFSVGVIHLIKRFVAFFWLWFRAFGELVDFHR